MLVQIAVLVPFVALLVSPLVAARLVDEL